MDISLLRPDIPSKTVKNVKMETLRLEEYSDIMEHKLVAAWQTSDATTWLPTEFMLAQYITRILVVGRTAPSSASLSADPSWTQVWRSPGAKEWSCLLGILPHMPGPILIVVGCDVTLTPKLIAGLKGTMTVVLRSPGNGWPPSCSPPDRIFFPILGDRSIVQEWIPRTLPRNLDLVALAPQLSAHGYGLMIAEGVWHWYKPADSPAMTTMTVSQVAKQLQNLSVILTAAKGE